MSFLSVPMFIKQAIINKVFKVVYVDFSKNQFEKLKPKSKGKPRQKTQHVDDVDGYQDQGISNECFECVDDH